MATSPKNIRGLRSLEKEIARLQLQAKELEDKMEDNMSYFQDHYHSLLLHSLIPTPKKESANGLISSFLQSDYLQAAWKRLGEKLAAHVGDVVNKLVDKLLHKKE